MSVMGLLPLPAFTTDLSHLPTSATAGITAGNMTNPKTTDGWHQRSPVEGDTHGSDLASQFSGHHEKLTCWLGQELIWPINSMGISKYHS